MLGDRARNVMGGLDRAEHHRNGCGNRLQLQSYVRNRAADADQRDKRRNALRLAVARRDEVGDRGDVLAFGEMDDASQGGAAKADHQKWSDIDSEKIVAAG